MKNDFYSTQDSNNKYSITICNVDGSGEIPYSFTIPEGNYNVLQMLKILNDNLLQVHFFFFHNTARIALVTKRS